MRVTAKVTKTGITVYRDGEVAGHRDVKLGCNWKGYNGINKDEAESLLEDEGLAVMTWFWNAEKKHYVTLLMTLEEFSRRFPPLRYAGRDANGREIWVPAA